MLREIRWDLVKLCQAMTSGQKGSKMAHYIPLHPTRGSRRGSQRAWPTIHPCARSKRETCGMAHREPVTSSVLARHLAACPQPRFELINSQGFLSFPPFPTVKAKILNIEGYSSSKTIMDDQRRSGMIMGNEIIGMCLH